MPSGRAAERQSGRAAERQSGKGVPALVAMVPTMSEQHGERSVRTLRVGEQVRHILSEILQRGDVHDETLANHMVSITEVRMSPDLRHATAFVKPCSARTRRRCSRHCAPTPRIFSVKSPPP